MGKPRIGLLVTCLVDLFRPAVGFATISLLELAGCEVRVPIQTCCGQPAPQGKTFMEAWNDRARDDLR